MMAFKIEKVRGKTDKENFDAKRASSRWCKQC